ncbi:unnamed protein product [Lactuca saligna]|uniref:Homeobox domain-containing protein n=1 Tax=Lactuca saligna TaxID=75948 RepID=A0AA35Z968_LACSI|nr:unnamed protein product [Lactuca saligna]
MSSVYVKEVTSSSGGGSSRWYPTPDQLMLLQRMYRGGLKTPSAAQVQQITERLSSFGHIQGKNVFYWFQNRKARERQKLRKKFMNLFQQHHLYPAHHQPGLPLHHVSGLEDASSWKGDLPSAQTCNLICDCRFVTMMMMDPGDIAPYCTRVPPKTLQLFPVTTTISADLKQDDVQQSLAQF